MYDIEKYYQATSIIDACSAKLKDPNALIIAGGSDVLIKIREGKLAACSLISIHGITELEGISINEKGTIIIRPLTSFRSLSNDPIILNHIPMLAHAVDQVGGPQIRNIATIGGNICNGVTSADSATTLLTLNAILEISELELVNGKQVGLKQSLMPISNFYVSPGKVNLKPGQLLTGIHITKENYTGYFGYYIKYAKRNAMDIATLGCAICCKFNKELSKVEDIRLAFGVAGPIPMRCPKTEAKLKGMEISLNIFNDIGLLASKEVQPRDSWRASKIFRLQLVMELSRRALEEVVEQAKAGGK